MITIYRPVKTNLITQSFGINGTKKELVPQYNSLGLKAHDGIDFAVNCKDNEIRHGGQCEQVYCNVDANLKIIYIQKDDEKGYGINAQTEDGLYKFTWWHFDTINPILYIGSTISTGDLLGTAGNTGISTGAHCHFGMYPLSESKDNGYKGAVDPLPYYKDYFVCDVMNKYRAVIELLKSLINLLLNKK